MTKARDLADYIATGVSDTELDILDGLTTTTAELNILDGVTSTAAELNILDGVTTTTAELNILDGVTTTAAEINLIDGGTARGTTAVADGDGFLTNDGGTMRMTKVDTLATYMQNKIIGGTSIVTTGALDSGSITSGFGTINTGSSAITTTGLISGGSLDIDNVLINGTTIGHTDDTDLITLADGVVTVAGEVSMTTLDIGGTNVTSTAAELNILDGVTATATELNIMDGVTSTTAELNILDGVTSTAAELNILDGVTSTAAELNILDGVTSTAAELNVLDGITAVVGELNALDIGSTAVGTAVASKAVILDSNKDYTGVRNFTLTGELDAATLDISGAIDVAGNSVLASVDVTGVATAATFEPDGDTAAGDNAAIGYTAAEGLILTGQGSTSDITLKNDADATVFTVPTGTDDILFPDNAKAMFGAGSDLQISHDGSNSKIVELGAGNLLLQSSGNGINLQKSNGNAMIDAVTDGAVTLYHNNAAKLATESGGVNVTGYLDADNFKINGAQGSDGQVLTSTGSGVAFESIPASGAYTVLQSTTLTQASQNTVVEFNSLSGYKIYHIIIEMFCDNGGGPLLLRFNSDATNTAYGFVSRKVNQAGNANSDNGTLGNGTSSIPLGEDVFEGSAQYFIQVSRLNDAKQTTVMADIFAWKGGDTDFKRHMFGGVHNASTAFDNMELIFGGQAQNNANIRLLGLA
jgi:hypothetical protein